MSEDKLVKAMGAAWVDAIASDAINIDAIRAALAIARRAIRNATLDEAAETVIYQASVLKASPGSATYQALEYARRIVLALKSKEPSHD